MTKGQGRAGACGGGARTRHERVQVARVGHDERLAGLAALVAHLLQLFEVAACSATTNARRT